ncbi:hypothetical protein CNMCM5878_010113 [Aspergillus fumigatiaffinis]|nr:hypothetical protein CNMCM5878_010113 [Aspergillus fumigatiaffinis]
MLSSGVKFAWANMFYFTNLLESWKASSSASGGGQSPAFQATNEIISNYQSMMIKSNSGKMEDTASCKPSSADPIQDVVAAEMNFRISYIRDYHGIEITEGQFCILFTARLQRLPDKLYLISCPQLIHAPDLTSDNRELLRVRLDAAADSIRKEEWDKLKSRYDIVKKEWFIVSDE